MPLILICRRCETEVDSEDSFCQECGLSQRQSGTHCRAENSSVDKISIAIESGKTPTERLPHRRIAPGTPFSFRRNEKVEESGMRGGFFRVTLNMATVTCFLLFAVALSGTAFSLFRKSEKVRLSNLAATAQNAAAHNDFESVFKSLSAMKNFDGFKFDEHQQALLDEAAFRMGEQEFAAGRKTRALAYLRQVSIVSDCYVGAREMIFKITSPMLTAAVQKKKGAALSARRLAPDAVVPPPSQLPELTEEQPSKLSSAAVLSVPRIPEIEKASGGFSGDADPADSASDEKSVGSKFSEAEMSRYNSLLGAYLRRQSAEKIEESEPPSFLEWIKKGKPGF